MEQLNGGQMLGVVGMVLGALVALLGWLLRLMMPWMQKRIDVKNGAIESLVGEAQRLIAANCQMSEVLLMQLKAKETALDERFEALQENCRRHTDELSKLVQSIKDAKAA